MSRIPVTIHYQGRKLIAAGTLAQSLGSRLKGLLGTDALEEGCGLVIPQCRQVHTFFMRYAIDVVFLDSNSTILKWQTLAPWKFSSWVFRAASVLEVPAGFAAKQSLRAGEKLEVITRDPA